MLWALLFIDLFGLVTSDRDRMGWHNDIHQFPVGQVALSRVLGERLNQKLQQVSYILFFLTKQSSFGHCFSSFSHQPDTEKAPPEKQISTDDLPRSGLSVGHGLDCQLM